MTAYANHEDLEQRWKTLTLSEETRADILLEDASAIVADRVEKHGKDPDEIDANILKSVVCAMVRRAMDLPGGLAGVTQASQTAGSYSESYTYGGATGELYLKKSELYALGIAGGRIGTIAPNIGGYDD